MKENLKAFLQKASEDDTLQAKLAEINASVMSDARAKFIKLAEENGFTLTEEDMDPVTAEREKLSEDELNAVAGGAYTIVSSMAGGRLCSDCHCTINGSGSSDSMQKKCACFMGGCGELTKLGKEKADRYEIYWTGNKGAKVAMFCALVGQAWDEYS